MKVSPFWRKTLTLLLVWSGVLKDVYCGGCSQGETTFVRTSSVMLSTNIYTSSDDYIALVHTDPTVCYNLCYNNDDCKSYILDHINQTCILTKEDHSIIRRQLKPHPSGSYHRKICLPGFSCKRHWAFDVIPGIRLVEQEDKVVPDIGNEDRCIKACSIEKSFVCRSAIFDFSTNDCVLSIHDRRIAPEAFKMFAEEVDYLENQCVSEPSQCIFYQQNGRMLAHVHVHLSLTSLTRERCQAACVNHSDFRCRSFMFDEVRALCLLTPEDSYSTPEIALNTQREAYGNVYELGSCIDVKMQCDSTSMTAILRVSTPFRGRVYALGHPNECYAVTAGDNGEIAITLPLHGRNCGTKNSGNGTFTNSVVVQHHPIVLTNTDRRIEVVCDYEEVKRRVRGGKKVEEGEFQSLSQVVTGLAPTPIVQLRVVTETGKDVRGVKLGDPLFLKIEMLDENIYGITGRGLVARSGQGLNTILLIDDRGCPVEPNVFPSLSPVQGSKSLQAPFQAFKFATDSTVKFQMTVSFCLDVCPPVNCTRNDTQSLQRLQRSIPVADTSILELQVGDVVNDVTMESMLFTVTDLKSEYPPEQQKINSNIQSDPIVDPSRKGLCVARASVIIVAAFIGILQVALISFCVFSLIFTRKSSEYPGNIRQIMSRASINSNTKLFSNQS